LVGSISIIESFGHKHFYKVPPGNGQLEYRRDSTEVKSRSNPDKNKP